MSGQRQALTALPLPLFVQAIARGSRWYQCRTSPG